MFLSFDLRFCLRTNRGNLLPALVIMEVVVLISGADCPIFFFSLLFFFCQTVFFPKIISLTCMAVGSGKFLRNFKVIFQNKEVLGKGIRQQKVVANKVITAVC